MVKVADSYRIGGGGVKTNAKVLDAVLTEVGNQLDKRESLKRGGSQRLCFLSEILVLSMTLIFFCLCCNGIQVFWLPLQYSTLMLSTEFASFLRVEIAVD